MNYEKFKKFSIKKHKNKSYNNPKKKKVKNKEVDYM